MRNLSLPEELMPARAPEREPNPREDHLATLHEAAELADYLRAEREALMQRIRNAGKMPPGTEMVGGLAIAREFSDLMDAVIARMFVLACQRVGANPHTLPIVIVAT